MLLEIQASLNLGTQVLEATSNFEEVRPWPEFELEQRAQQKDHHHKKVQAGVVEVQQQSSPQVVKILQISEVLFSRHGTVSYSSLLGNLFEFCLTSLSQRDISEGKLELVLHQKSLLSETR